jgi:predicted cupin superfamily sugar epimerase
MGKGERKVPDASSLLSLSAAQVAGVLGMLPHREGGYYRETYRSAVAVPTAVGSRSLCTAILYLLTADDPSRFHRLRFDEVWFFHSGAPVEMVFLDPVETAVLGPDAPQALAPGGRWMAARIAEDAFTPGPAWALVGCVVSPGFEYDDFEAGEREALLAMHPQAAEYIQALA